MHTVINDTLDVNQTQSQTTEADYAMQIQAEIQRLHNTHQQVESLIPQLSAHRPIVLKELRSSLAHIQTNFEEQKDKLEHLKCSIEERNTRRLAKKEIKASKKISKIAFYMMH